METSRALTIGWPCQFTAADLLGTTNLWEFDTIIFYPEKLQQQLLGNRTFASADQASRAALRLTELENWVRAGHALIVICSPISSMQVQGGQPFNLPNILPLGLAKLNVRSGHRIEYCGPTQANAVLEEFCDKVRYTVILEGGVVKGLLRADLAQKGPDQLVGGYVAHDKGIVIFLPPILFNVASDANAYAKAIVALPKILAGNYRPEAPEWVDKLWTPDEAGANAIIKAAVDEIDARRAKIAVEEERISHARRLKELFYATGDPFQQTVAAALEELGIKAIRGPHPRADILGLDGNTILAIETKGVEGSARERNLRQVATWKEEVQLTLASTVDERAEHPILAGYASQLEELGVTTDGSVPYGCKGIMIIGTYRLTPLPDRNQQNEFSNDLQSKIKLSHVCALTGLQLHTLLMQARAAPDKKNEIRRALLETDGVLPNGNDWQSYLSSNE